MPYPLVLIGGIIAEEPQDQIGAHPYIHVSAGALIAGGTGYKVFCIDGYFVQVYDDGTYVVIWDIEARSIWDSGLSIWDSGSSIWDVAEALAWDGGSAVWDDSLALWGVGEATTWDQGIAWT